MAVRLAGFYTPELGEPRVKKAKTALERIVSGKLVKCEARNRPYDRMVAQCTVGGRSVGELMRQSGVAEGGKGLPRALTSLLLGVWRLV